jgi:hypothetical protein
VYARVADANAIARKPIRWSPTRRHRSDRPDQT